MYFYLLVYRNKSVYMFFQPLSVSNQMIQMALKHWIKMATTSNMPLIIYNGVVVKFPVLKGLLYGL